MRRILIYLWAVAACLATIAACATTPPVDCSKAMVEYYGCKYEALAPEPQDCFATSEAYYGCRAAAIGGEK